MALALNIVAVGFAAMAAIVAVIIRKRVERDHPGELFSDSELRKQQKRPRARMAS